MVNKNNISKAIHNLHSSNKPLVLSEVSTKNLRLVQQIKIFITEDTVMVKILG